MQLKDLLEELRVNILHDRSDHFDGDDSGSDYLWSNRTLIRYIDEAQRRFARLSLCLRDGTTADVTRVTLETGVSQYLLHKSVIAVLSARPQDVEGDMPRAGHGAFNAYRAPDFSFNQFANMQPGPPVAYSTDEMIGDNGSGALSQVSMRIYPTPSADVNGKTIFLRVVRLPIVRFDGSKMEAEPEIPEDHHLEMLDWAAYLALRIQDSDAGDRAAADKFAASFGAHVKAARDLAMRKMFAPQQWGFGRNGFSWSND